MADLASQLTAYARSVWPQWAVMMTELEKRGVDANDATLAVNVLRDHAHLGASAIDWPGVESDIRSILAPTPPAPSAGFTVLTPAADSRILHVATNGSDANTLGDEAHPYATIAKAQQQMRKGFPDWLLRKRGDTFAGQPFWEHSGRSPTEPAVFGAYGVGPRPRLVGRLTRQGNEPLSHVAIVGLDFVVDPANPSQSGIQWLAFGEDYLFEDLRFLGGYGLAIQPMGPPSVLSQAKDVRVRRCLVLDTDDNGVLISHCNGLSLEENVIEHCAHPATVFGHGAYLSETNTGVTVIGNLFSRSGSHGIQQRCGGVNEDNLYLSNPINLQMGIGLAPDLAGVEAWCRRNTIIGGGDIAGPLVAANPGLGGPRGWGVIVGNISKGEMAQTIIADGTGGMQIPLCIDADATGNATPQHPNGAPTCGVLNFKIHGNVRRGWGGSVVVDPGPKTGTTALSDMGMEERADLAGIDIRTETYRPGFLDRARNRGPEVWVEEDSAAAHGKWARGRMSMAP